MTTENSATLHRRAIHCW